MTDTNPGCWPDKPGVPKDPELDRWHWMLVAEGEPPVAVLWHKQLWHLGYIGMPAWVFANAVYLGPCHTPAEVAAQVEAVRREEREWLKALCDAETGRFNVAGLMATRLYAAICARGDA
jgi:hypothetical protein